MVSIIIILMLYVALMVGVGVYYRSKSSSVSGFVLGGRSLGPWITAFAYGTSYFSAVVFIGYAGQFGWQFGVSATWIGIGNALLGSLLAWLILGKRTRAMTAHLDASTMPQFFEKRYKSKGLKVFSALIVFIFLIPYTASVYNGLSRLFGMVFDVDYGLILAVMALLTAVYVIIGGYMATAMTDFIQGIIMLGGIVMVIVTVLSGKGGFYSAMIALSQDVAKSGPMEGMQGAYSSFFGPDPLNLLGVIILTSLGTWGLPQMVHKFYTIKSEKSIKAGTIISTIFAMVIAGGSYFLGGFGRIYVTPEQITNSETGKMMYDKIVPTMLNTALPDILMGVVIVLVLSASMSTLSSLVLTSSSTLTLDLVKPYFMKEASEKKQVFVMRIFIAVFLVISVVIALNPNTLITTLMSISWGALAGAFLAPFMYGLFWKGVTKSAVLVSFICGVGVTLIHMFVFSLGLFPNLTIPKLPFNIASPINAGAFAMILGLILVPLVSLITKKMQVTDVDKIFSCYQKKN